MSTAITNFIPEMPPEHWAAIGGFVRAAVTDCDQQTPYKARELLISACRHVHWCVYTAGLPLERETIFHRDVIAEYAAHGCPELRPASAGNRRSQLLRMAERLLPPQQRTSRLAPFPPARASAPYTPAEQVALRSWATGQTTTYKQVNCQVLLALGLGAGLSAAEVGGVRARHILVDGEGVMVEVAGERARLVPVLAEWEPALVTIAEAAIRPDLYVFRPRRDGNPRNQVSSFVKQTSISGVRPNLQRMRATWLVTHLTAGTPVKALVQAAGLESLEPLTRFLCFVPAVDPDAYRLALRKAWRTDDGDAP